MENPHADVLYLHLISLACTQDAEKKGENACKREKRKEGGVPKPRVQIFLSSIATSIRSGWNWPVKR